MQEKGYDITRIKCSTKFQALKRTYKTILDHNNKSGNNRQRVGIFKGIFLNFFLHKNVYTYVHWIIFIALSTFFYYYISTFYYILFYRL